MPHDFCVTFFARTVPNAHTASGVTTHAFESVSATLERTLSATLVHDVESTRDGEVTRAARIKNAPPFAHPC